MSDTLYDLDVTVADGKYTVRANNGTNLHALRYGQEWRDLIGDGLVLALATEVQERQRENDFLRDLLDAFEWRRINGLTIDEVQKELLESGHTEAEMNSWIEKVRAMVGAAAESAK